MSRKSKYLGLKKQISQYRLRKKKGPQLWPVEKTAAFPPFGRKLLVFTLSAIAVGLLLGGMVLLGYRLLSGSSFFQITSIKIEGNRRVDSEYLRALSGASYRTNLLALDLEAVQRKIEDHAWVESARVKRELPSELVITVKERTPIVLVNGGDGLYFVDKNGRIFTSANQQEDLDFPVITGLEQEVDALNTGDGTLWDDRKGELAKILSFIRYAGNGNSGLPRQNISELHVSKDDGIVLFLADRSFPIFLGDSLAVNDYYHLAKVLYWLYKKKEFSGVNFIRMDYMDNKVLVGKNND